MRCPTGNVNFGTKSKKALQYIQGLQRNHQMAAAFFSLGLFTQVMSNKAAQTIYNVTTTDWRLFTEAAGQFSPILRHAIGTQAGVLANDYTLNQPERDFWACVLTSSY